jgi:hypothetical protein
LCLGLTLFGLALATIIFFLGKTLFEITQFSHSHVFQNQTLEEVKNRTTVVRPLVDEKQSFDIAVSVWSLPVEEHDGERNGSVSETALYSDIVFRGLRLADQHKLANLTYKLPVAVLCVILFENHEMMTEPGLFFFGQPKTFVEGARSPGILRPHSHIALPYGSSSEFLDMAARDTADTTRSLVAVSIPFKIYS